MRKEMLFGAIRLTNYGKGSRAERELLHMLSERGWAVVRNAASGVMGLGPDLVCLKDNTAIIIECKAWNKASLSIDQEQFSKLLEWEKSTKFPTFVGWRMNNKGWYFLKTEEFTKGSTTSYNITKKKTLEINRLLEKILPFEKLTISGNVPVDIKI